MSEQIIRVPGKFVPFEAGTPLMDEKDIKKTSQVDSEDVKTEGGVLKFADKAYVPNDFSGMGRVYLRKNMINASLHFADIISDLPSTETETLFDCDEIVYETTNNRFLAVKHTSEGKKYYPNYQFTGSEDFSEPDDKHIYVCDANAKLYTYENGALEETTTLMDKNVLTQDMINKPNTIYIIQYDYDIVDKEDTTTTNNLTIGGEYYSYKPITIEDNQTYRALNDCVFIDYQHNSLIGSALVTGENESQDFAIAKKSSAASGVPVSYYSPNGTINVPANCVLQFEGGSIKSGTIVGNGTYIHETKTNKILDISVNLEGTWNNNCIFVTWFGKSAVNDAPFFNTALKNAKSSKIRNVLVPNGSYLLTETVKVPSDTSLRGEYNIGNNYNPKYIAYISVVGDIQAIELQDNDDGMHVGCNGISIENLFFEHTGTKGNSVGIGNKANTGTPEEPIYNSYGVLGCKFKNIKLIEFTYGMRFVGRNALAYVQIESCTFNYNKWGISVELPTVYSASYYGWANAVTIKSSTLSWNTIGAINIQALFAENFNIAENTIEQNGKNYNLAEYEEYGCYGINVEVSYGAVDIHSNYFEDNCPFKVSETYDSEKEVQENGVVTVKSPDFTKTAEIIVNGKRPLLVSVHENYMQAHYLYFSIVGGHLSVNNNHISQIAKTAAYTATRNYIVAIFGSSYTNENANSDDVYLVFCDNNLTGSQVSSNWQFVKVAELLGTNYKGAVIKVDQPNFEKQYVHKDEVLSDDLYIKSSDNTTNYDILPTSTQTAWKTIQAILGYYDNIVKHKYTIHVLTNIEEIVSVVYTKPGADVNIVGDINGIIPKITISSFYSLTFKDSKIYFRDLTIDLSNGRAIELENSNIILYNCTIIMSQRHDYGLFHAKSGKCSVTLNRCNIKTSYDESNPTQAQTLKETSYLTFASAGAHLTTFYEMSEGYTDMKDVANTIKFDDGKPLFWNGSAFVDAEGNIPT